MVKCAKCGKTLKRGFKNDGSIPQHRLNRLSSFDRIQAPICPASGTKPENWSFNEKDWRI